jgi:hypothetical protein
MVRPRVEVPKPTAAGLRCKILICALAAAGLRINEEA